MIVLALALLLQAAAPIATPDPRSRDVVDLFEKMCVETAGSSVTAHRLDKAPQIARPMTADELQRTAPGGVAAEGWIVQSPHDAWAALWFAPSKRTCGVTVREAPPTGMKEQLESSLRAFYAPMGATIATAKPDETATVDSVPVHESSWLVKVGGAELAIISSFGDRPMGAKQHLMTFTVLRLPASLP